MSEYARAMQGATRLLDELPILATQIGYRTDSTAEETAFAEALFQVSQRWSEVRP